MVLAWGAVPGCKRPEAPTYYVDRIVFSETSLSSNPSLDLTVEGYREALIRALDASRNFKPVPQGQRPPNNALPFKVQAEVGYTKESEVTGSDAAGARAEVAVTLQFSRRAGPEMERFEERGLGTKTFDPMQLSQRRPAFRAALDNALSAAIQSVSLQLATTQKTEKELVADLSSPDPRIRDYAVRALTDRRSPAAVPALIERLSDPDPEVAKRTIGALRAIGDQRAVRALIDFTRNREPDALLPAIDAIGALGGPEAEAFLFTLESGHPDDAIRQSAAAAQKELQKRREHPKTPGTDRPRISQETR